MKARVLRWMLNDAKVVTPWSHLFYLLLVQAADPLLSKEHHVNQSLTQSQLAGELPHTLKSCSRWRKAVGSSHQKDLQSGVAGWNERALRHALFRRLRPLRTFSHLARIRAQHREIAHYRFPAVGSIGLLLLVLGGVGTALAGAQANSPNWSESQEVLERAIDAGAFPGCTVAVGTADTTLWTAAYGHLTYEGQTRVRTDTLYDLASLTKVLGTTSVVLTLVRDGNLALGDPVTRWLPEASPNLDGVTIEHLLAHCSGLPAGRPFFRLSPGYEATLRLAAATRLEAPPGTRARYSDIGFMLLGEVAARAGGKPLAELERERVLVPLGMRDTLRNPQPQLVNRIAPTEWTPAYRAALAAANGRAEDIRVQPSFVHGVVHDENARAAAGLTGHAGLFMTAEDAHLWARELLRGRAGRSRVFPKALLLRFTERCDLVDGSSRAVGWDTPSGKSSAGDLFSRRSFGHTGFTGTSIWIDPERKLYLVLLTNRVHPTRRNRKIYQVRRDLADAVARSVDRWRSGAEEPPGVQDAAAKAETE